jgi:hypothetical protein
VASFALVVTESTGRHLSCLINALSALLFTSHKER